MKKKLSKIKMPGHARLEGSRPRMHRQKISTSGKSAFPAGGLGFPGAGGTAGGPAFGGPDMGGAPPGGDLGGSPAPQDQGGPPNMAPPVPGQ